MLAHLLLPVPCSSRSHLQEPLGHLRGGAGSGVFVGVAELNQAIDLRIGQRGDHGTHLGAPAPVLGLGDRAGGYRLPVTNFAANVVELPLVLERILGETHAFAAQGFVARPMEPPPREEIAASTANEGVEDEMRPAHGA